VGEHVDGQRVDEFYCCRDDPVAVWFGDGAQTKYGLYIG